MKTKFLIVGAGMTGLAFANFIDDDDYLVLEQSDEIGGWCKTIKQDGFVWDFSGHFFHFRNPDIEKYLVDKMPENSVVTVEKDSRIFHDGTWIDFPFQKNIHQLPKQAFIDCLYDLYFREPQEGDSFKAMLYEKFGASIAEKFLVPYNEKLYACDLEKLDADAMGRFFPYADLADVIGNMKTADNASYNASFTYPTGGAIMYVDALANQLPDEKICVGEKLISIDLQRKVAKTNRREIEFENLVSSAPFDRLMAMTEIEHDPSVFTSNKVLVFNLGFDRKGKEDVHWVYYPDRDVSFYRVGFYDNILNTDRMSLYVEIGMPTDAEPDVEAALQQVLVDLKTSGVVTDHELVSWHTVTLDPAYVHITTASRTEHARLSDVLQTAGIYPVGRYGGWTYFSIEDNVIEAKALAERFNAVGR